MQIRNGQFLNGDCLEILPTLPAGAVGMVLCDLPYGTTRNAWDSVVPLEPLWREIWRLCGERAPVVLTASQPFTSVLGSSQIEHLRYDWTWHKSLKTNFLNAKKQPLRNKEDILVFYRKAGIYNPQMTPSGGTVSGGNKTTSNYGGWSPDGTEKLHAGYPCSVLYFPNPALPGGHPTQKPVALFEYLIRTYSEPGAVVLDMTAGSGTTAVAAERAGRRWICIERDEAYYWSAVARLLGGDE